MKRSPSFAKLVKDLSTEASAPASPTIERVSGKGMILGVGCSSRDNSARGRQRILPTDAGGERQGSGRR